MVYIMLTCEDKAALCSTQLIPAWRNVCELVPEQLGHVVSKSIPGHEASMSQELQVANVSCLGCDIV